MVAKLFGGWVSWERPVERHRSVAVTGFNAHFDIFEQEVWCSYSRAGPRCNPG